jgi:hypothetical protein
MQECTVEGVTTHGVPESCAVVREDGGEALTGVGRYDGPRQRRRSLDGVTCDAQKRARLRIREADAMSVNRRIDGKIGTFTQYGPKSASRSAPRCVASWRARWPESPEPSVRSGWSTGRGDGR